MVCPPLYMTPGRAVPSRCGLDSLRCKSLRREQRWHGNMRWGAGLRGVPFGRISMPAAIPTDCVKRIPKRFKSPWCTVIADVGPPVDKFGATLPDTAKGPHDGLSISHQEFFPLEFIAGGWGQTRGGVSSCHDTLTSGGDCAAPYLP
jgi:hypothetical protein